MRSVPGEFDVVLLGYGPVGATLANLLAQQGLKVAVLERESSVYHLARAGHFDAEVMRVFQSLGVAAQVEAITSVTRASRFVDADGTLLMESRRSLERGPLGWVSDYMFFQPALESILRKRAEETGRVTVLLRHDVYGIETHTDGVTVRAESLESGELVSVQGRYLVGCDGARSLVRRHIGAEHEDFGFRQRWLVVDVKQHRDLGLERATTHYCDPARPMLSSVLAQGVLRWEVMVLDSDDPAQITTSDAIWDFIARSPRPIDRADGTILRSAIYTFESLLAQRWREGRCVIAGDAAHRMPPFLGQGMCAGIRDAVNLAWKLAALCEGRADAALLDTYEQERRPHVQAFIEGAVEAGRILQMTDPQAVASRARAMRDSPRAWGPPNPPLGHGLSDAYGMDTTGWQLPQPQIDGVWLDDRIGHRFALVVDDSAPRHAAWQESAAAYPHLRCVVVDAASAGVLMPYQTAAVLVRPDRYVHAKVASPQALHDALAALPVRLGPG